MIDLLPRESMVYFGDTGRYPYGPRELAEVREFSFQIADYLVAQHQIRALVIACNTASAAALDALRERLEVPVVGVIEPGVRSAAKATSSGRVGVIGTVTTIGSGAYQQAFGSLFPEIELSCAACPGFVEFVERDDTVSDQVLVLAERLLAPLIDAKVDTLLLGCTHYPYLAKTIGRVMGRAVTLVSSADETAFAVRRDLQDWSPLWCTPVGDSGPDPTHRWLSTGEPASFSRIGRRLLGPEMSTVEGVSI